MPLVEIGQLEPGVWAKRMPRRCLVDRDATIVDLCRKKNVLHVGAADSPFHREKGQRGELLHQKIGAVASTVVGIDVDHEAVRWLREELGIKNIVIADATSEGVTFPAGCFDLVLCCDVLEHVPNPGDLLDACKSHMSRDTVLLLSTANATALKPVLRAMLGREAVHYGHLAYYSFGTICQLLMTKGFVPVRYGTFCYPAVTRVAGVIFSRLSRRFPAVADGIIVTAIRRDLP